MLQKVEEYRSNIMQLEEQMKRIPNVKLGNPDNCHLDHKFADGLYIRTIFVPAGMFIVTKIHKQSHPVFVLQGKVAVVEDSGVKILIGPCSFITPAGTKRVCFTYQDTVWSTVHATNETDLDKIERDVISENFDEFDKLDMVRVIDHIEKGEAV